PVLDAGGHDRPGTGREGLRRPAGRQAHLTRLDQRDLLLGVAMDRERRAGGERVLAERHALGVDGPAEDPRVGRLRLDARERAAVRHQRAAMSASSARPSDETGSATQRLRWAPSPVMAPSITSPGWRNTP